MGEMKHTPLPWKADKFGTFIFCESAKGGDRPVLDTRGWGYLTGNGHGAIKLPPAEAAAEQKAVADFVVNAANSHEALVEACRALCDAYPEDDEDNSIENLWARYGSEFADAIRKARCALSKANAAGVPR